MNRPTVGRVHIGPVPVDAVTADEAVRAIGALVERYEGGTVFTPNVDHVVLAATNAAFCRAYAAVDLALADGMPIVWAARALGHPLPAKVSGSDLVAPLMALAARARYRVFFLGGAEGVAARAAERLKQRYPRLIVAGTSSPRVDLDTPAEQRRGIVDEVRRAEPDLVLVSLGAPKQELWMHESAAALRPAVLIGVGASIDFEAGTARRCPAWMSRAGLEWSYRLAHEPRRLWRRYLLRDPKFVGVVLRHALEERGFLMPHGELTP